MPLHHSWKLPEPQPVSRNVIRLVNVNSPGSLQLSDCQNYCESQSHDTLTKGLE